jgi:hypothetical protein
MGFDEEVDAAREKLEAALAVESSPDAVVDDLPILEDLLPQLRERIKSRRLGFQLTEDEGEAVIDILHQDNDEALGFVFVADGELVFESNLDEYFDDFVDEDPESFMLRLYETLRADLPKYEIESR